MTQTQDTFSHQRKILVIQTPEGFLEDDISEGWMLDDGEPNYSFTGDPFRALEFPDRDFVPKYLGISPVPKLKLMNAEHCADYLGGKLVTIELTVTHAWQIAE